MAYFENKWAIATKSSRFLSKSQTKRIETAPIRMWLEIWTFTQHLMTFLNPRLSFMTRFLDFFGPEIGINIFYNNIFLSTWPGLSISVILRLEKIMANFCIKWGPL
jgi:hypothetical protein